MVALYKNLRGLLNIPYSVYPFDKLTATGAKIYGEPTDSLCYAEGKVTVVKNKQGKEVVSNTRLYVDGDTIIKALDKVVFDNNESEVQAVSAFYERGKISLRVVYL